MGHKSHFSAIFLFLFTAAVIGCNVYSFLPHTPWYTFTVALFKSYTFSGSLTRPGVLYSNSITEGITMSEWEGDSKTRDVVYQTFGFVIVSFVLSCLVILMCLVSLLKHLHKKARKVLFVVSIFSFIANGLAAFLFFRVNKSFCNDLSGAISLPGVVVTELNGSDLCSHFKGGSDSSLASVNWGPGIGWWITIASFGCSLFVVIFAHRVLRQKKFGYHIIH
ncbi:hypothetical protein CYY_002366 [Polysphondylium violaceum]|uniref:Transmembrane protein n=1 Tax=Polysphondylium violaceum TaxID=133409 RepID=A0A8J4PZG3_9MYCE|nr:hypothetical protein CYY_002366 [Polysphondylium violaceum]